MARVQSVNSISPQQGNDTNSVNQRLKFSKSIKQEPSIEWNESTQSTTSPVSQLNKLSHCQSIKQVHSTNKIIIPNQSRSRLFRPHRYNLRLCLTCGISLNRMQSCIQQLTVWEPRQARLEHNHSDLVIRNVSVRRTWPGRTRVHACRHNKDSK